MKKHTLKAMSFFLTLLLVFGAAGSITLAAPEPPEQPEDSVVLPDLSGYEMPEPPAKTEISAARMYAGPQTSEPQIFDSSQFDTTPINGIDFELPPLPARPSINAQRATSFSLTPTVVGQQQTITEHIFGGTMQVTLAGIGNHCKVYVKSTDAKYADFAPGHTNVAAIISEFDNEIYPLVYNNFGAPTYISGTSGKINLVLYDIAGDAGSSGGYIAGFFNGNDYYPQGIYGSNEDTILYIDIGSNQGYARFAQDGDTGKASFFGTIAHELQHLVNFSYWVTDANAVEPDTSDPDYNDPYTEVSTWYNEGLSGLVDVMYLHRKNFSMDLGHLGSFLAKEDLPSNSGYVPTSAQWLVAGGAFAHYGASSVIIQEYYAVSGNAKRLVQNSNVGYWPSLWNVAQGYGYTRSTQDFNSFFTIANLNMQVDSPDGPPTRYYSNITRHCGSYDNTWKLKSVLEQYFGTFDKQLPENTAIAFDSGGRTYYTETYLSDPIGAGNSAVQITLPASPDAEYYVITPFNATGIDNRTSWDAVPKEAAKLNAGANAVTVGTNNMFAILAIAHDTPVNESIEYAILVPVTSITVEGDGGETEITTLGATLQMHASVLPTDATNQTVTWTVIDGTGSATIDANGLLTAVSYGTVTVRATANDGSGVYGEIEITIKKIPVTSITVTGDGGLDYIDTPNGTLQMHADVQPADASDPTISWQVDYGTGGANIDNNGLLLATRDGTVTVRATANDDPGVFDEMEITISGQTVPSVPVTSITIGSDSGETEITTLGGTLQLSADVQPEDASNGDITWLAINRTGRAVVDNNGLLTALREGTVTVRATANDGSDIYGELEITIRQSAQYTVTLSANPTYGGTVSGEGTFAENTDCTVIATANSGYRFVNWTEGGVSVSSSASYSFPLDRDRNLVANFRDNTSSSSSGGGGGSRRSSDTTIITTTPTTTWMEKGSADTLVANAKSKNEGYARTKSGNMYGVRSAALQALAGLRYEHDTIVDGAVQVRLGINNPEKITKDIMVSGFVKGTAVDWARGYFEKWFKNKVRVVHLDQQGDFGQPVQIAAKVDLTGMDTKKLSFYTYDKATNAYKSIPEPAYRVDANNYLHFTTPFAGDIIISDGPLEKK